MKREIRVVGGKITVLASISFWFWNNSFAENFIAVGKEFSWNELGGIPVAEMETLWQQPALIWGCDRIFGKESWKIQAGKSFSECSPGFILVFLGNASTHDHIWTPLQSWAWLQSPCSGFQVWFLLRDSSRLQGCQLPEICPWIVCTYLDILCKWMIKCSAVLALLSWPCLCLTSLFAQSSWKWGHSLENAVLQVLNNLGSEPSGWAEVNLANTFCPSVWKGWWISLRLKIMGWVGLGF